MSRRKVNVTPELIEKSLKLLGIKASREECQSLASDLELLLTRLGLLDELELRDAEPSTVFTVETGDDEEE